MESIHDVPFGHENEAISGIFLPYELENTREGEPELHGAGIGSLVRRVVDRSGGCIRRLRGVTDQVQFEVYRINRGKVGDAELETKDLDCVLIRQYDR